MKLMDRSKVVEIEKNIYWVGGSCQEGGLHCNPYLIIDGEEAVLIDPGSVIDFEYVYENVCSLVPLEKIKYVILHHQDPDFCSSVPLFEQRGANFKIVTHWRTETLVKYYGIKSDYYIVNKNDFRLVLESGRELQFVQTPYLHFAGAIVTYDCTSKVLFSSDLFGAFSYGWSLYAKEDYIEKMKTFHEHYMPSNDILRPVMEVFLGMDISIIAPQHGSIIKDNPSKYIKVLRDLECGTFITPIKKDISKSGGYSLILSSVLKRLVSIINKEEVLEVIDDLNITVDETFTVTDYNYTGSELWNLFFEKALARKGILWLIVIEPLVYTLSKEYDIAIPSVFLSKLKKAEEIAITLSKENELLKEINSRLQKSIKETEDKLIRCHVTGLYNYEFFKNYLSSDIKDMMQDANEQNPALIIINIDNLAKIRFSYGDSEVEEILKNIAYIFESIKEDNELYFRLQGATFACYIPHSAKERAVELAEKIRSSIGTSEKFIEKITVSIGVVDLTELRDSKTYNKGLEDVMYNIAMMRVRLAKEMGMNIVCSSSSVKDYQEELGNILLVDTDSVNIDVIKTFLENLNYKVITAGDGEEALSAAENFPLDLIISEIMIPKMDGFLLREKLLSQSATKNIPFIIVSLLKDENSVKRAASLGVEHYFKKPFMLSELIGVIQNKIKGESYL
ncbi:response regulator [Clostridium sp. WILCCON 0185]|uniref:Stage 0 sporulation protein A homolog n=2 Tax=Candidatus Clostridium stratigraminis TaxID=3381661 RepID=A0ABW8SYB8_9CLOT